MYRKVILNPRNASLEEILERLKSLYPTAIIKKPWIGPRMIRIPVDNYQLWVHHRKGKLIADFNPPIWWSLAGMFGFAIIMSIVLTLLLQTTVISIGGAIPVLIGFLVVKAVFRNKNRDLIDRFYADVDRAAGDPDVNSIF